MLRGNVRFVLFILVILLIIVAFNIKNIGRQCYPIKYSNYVYEYSKKYNLDPYFVAAVIKTESNYNPMAKSSKNAYGLMQITSSTGDSIAERLNIQDFSKEKLYNPEYNIDIGCWYLSDLKQEFNNMELVAAAYNGGRGNVKKWLSNSQYSSDGKTLKYIPYGETDKYVKRVRVNYNIYKWIYGTKK